MVNQKSIDIAKERRTIYQLGKDITLSHEEISELVQNAMIASPTAFHSQTVRAVVLFGEHHVKLWDLTLERLRPEVPTEEAMKATSAKIAGFKAAAGTVLLFRDQAVVKQLEEQFTLYKDNFHDWAEQGLGGFQQLLWTALRENNIGANLQHYNPLIDEQVAKEFAIPENWDLRGQMVFGSIEGPDSGKKEFLPLEDTFKIFE